MAGSCSPEAGADFRALASWVHVSSSFGPLLFVVLPVQRTAIDSKNSIFLLWKQQ